MNHVKNLGLLLLSLLIIFAILDFFNLTSWLVYPYSSVTNQNNGLTSALGNTPSTNGG